MTSRRTNLLRVLSYGRVDDSTGLERHMEHLARHHPVVSIAEVLDTFEGGHALPPGAVLLVFHELEGFLDTVWPVLSRRAFAAALFVHPASASAAHESLRSLAAQGVALGLERCGEARAADVPLARLHAELCGALQALERVQPGLARLIAYPDWPADQRLLAAARLSGFELGFGARAGTNDLRSVDRLCLRSLAIDAQVSPEELGTRLATSSAPWGRALGRTRGSREERRAERRRRAQRRRLRFVSRPLDAVLTAGLKPRSGLSSALRALLRARSSHYERLRSLVRLVTPPVPALERRLQRALLVTRRLPLTASGVELLGYGSAATVFRTGARAGNEPYVLKTYRWTLGLPAAELVRIVRRHRARYQRLRGWFGERVLPTHFLVLAGPVRGLPVAACLQVQVESASDLLARSDAELLALFRSRPELRAEFAAFARQVLEVRAQGFFPDLLGPGNLLLVERAQDACVRLIDYGLFDLRCGTGHLPVELIEATTRRLEALLLLTQASYKP